MLSGAMRYLKHSRWRVSGGGHHRFAAALLALALMFGVADPAAAQESDPPSPQALLERDGAAGADDQPRFEQAPRAAARQAMVREQIEARGVSDPAVLGVLRRVPRHAFVPDQAAGRAYADTPLAIGHGQTISQPFIVGFMTELLELETADRVLEVGTGSAYQAAVLGQIVDSVVSIEIIRPLAQSAAARLEALGYSNIGVLHGDGYYGYPAAAPFDAIVVTAAASHVPPPLIDQLRAGGRMVIPVGEGWTQNLLLIEKDQQGETTTRNLMAVRFVPLTGDH